MQSQGSISELATRGSLAAQIREQQELLNKTQEEIDPEAIEPTDPVAKADGKLIVAEEVQLGHVSSSAGALKCGRSGPYFDLTSLM